MENWQLLLVVLATLVVGACLPIAFELRATLRAARELFESLRPRSERALDDVSRATAKLERIVAPFEDGKRVDQILEGAEGLTKTAEAMAGTVRIASAIGASLGPVIASAIRARAETSEGNSHNHHQTNEDKETTS